MSTGARFALACLALCPCTLAQEKSAEAPDLLRGVIDPYISTLERGRFSQAAGVDNELEESEFKPGNGFVRVFDKWPAIRSFDADNDARIDWFEADAYRKALARSVKAKYDANRNGKLDADERAMANRDLAAGKAPPVTKDAPTHSIALGGSPANTNRPNPFVFGQPGQPGQLPPQLVKMIDTNQDGQVSREERIAAIHNFRNKGWAWALKQYDKDGDGKISSEERAAAPPPIRLAMKIDDLGLRDFDENRDGKLDDGEYAALDDYFQKWMKVSEQNMTRFADTDGDGKISPEEQAALQSKMQAVTFQILPKVMGWADSDGDGQASPQEWMGLVDRFSGAFDQQIDRYTRRFDANGDGRLDAAERDALIEGLQADDRERRKRFDADGDGKLSVPEMLAAFEDAANEWGLKPSLK